MTSESTLLDARELYKVFHVKSAGLNGGRSYAGQKVELRAVDGVSLRVAPGEIVGVVGESGCGKSTLARMIVCLEEPTRGEVIFDGVNLLHQPGRELRALRRRFQIVFQDPYSSLNPRIRVADALAEALKVHGIGTKADRAERVAGLFRMVELGTDLQGRYPAHLSGGQRQRVGIARALAVQPDLIVADEPVSSMDVSVQAQILNLIRRLRGELGVAWIFVGHNLSVVHYIADRIAIMYLGRIVEEGPASVVFTEPLHPYTRGLLESAPEPDPRARLTTAPLQGDPPSPTSIPQGCRFASRCPIARQFCRDNDPGLRQHAAGHSVACWAVTEPGSWESGGSLDHLEAPARNGPALPARTAKGNLSWHTIRSTTSSRVRCCRHSWPAGQHCSPSTCSTSMPTRTAGWVRWPGSRANRSCSRSGSRRSMRSCRGSRACKMPSARQPRR
jgi:oligopeptide/dipeptide ABC transporter ATP-binding protein